MASKAAISLFILAACVCGVHAQPRSSQSSSSGAPDIEITSRKGCGPGPYLTPNMQDCVIDELMGSNGTLTVGFSVSPRATTKHSLLLTLRSVGGAAVMRVLAGTGYGMFNSRVVYFNDAVTESVLRIRADDLTGGDYTLVIQGMGGATQKLLLYLRVQTPLADVRLSSTEKGSMYSIYKECCPVTSGLEAPEVCSTFLPRALKAAKPEDDLCNVGNFACNSKGQLEKIDFSNAGLKCKTFPEAFGEFPALETLMLRFNNFNEDTFENVAKVLSTATNLRRLMMGNANITGTIPCRLFQEHELKTLMFSVNKLSGEMPPCVLAHKSLEELYMSRLPLTGPLPDSIPTDSALTVWYAINRDPMTGKTAGPGFTGALPKSISNAADLQFVELSGHQLTGGVPPLPDKVRMFEIHRNKLDGSIATPLPTSMIYFDVSNNSLTGPVPDVSNSKELTLLDLSQNQLTGSLPNSLGNAGGRLVYLDVSKNKLSGPVESAGWESMPSLQYAFLQDNALEGTVPTSLAQNKKLVALNMAFNKLSGNLESFAENIPPPRKISPQMESIPSSSSSGIGRKLAGCMGSSHSKHSTAQHARPGTPQHTSAQAADSASLSLAKKMLGTREDWSVVQVGQAVKQHWSLDMEGIRALATGQLSAARRRLMQSVKSEPAPGGATTSVVEPPSVPLTADKPAAPTSVDPATADEPEEQTADAPASTAESPSSAAAPTVEPTPSTTAPSTTTSSSSRPPTTPMGMGPRSSSGPMSGGRPPSDVGFISVPSRSQLSGNSMLYFNLSNNEIEGGVPEKMGNLEMFRSPANSTDPFDLFVFSRGGPDRTLDLTYNKLYGEFPRFLINSNGDLSDACLCITNFSVSAGNQLFCPTKSALSGFKATPANLDTIKNANFTCLLPNQAKPVSLAKYLSDPSGYITEVPSQSQLPAPEPKSRNIESPSGSGSSKKGAKGGLGVGEIAGIAIGAIAGVAVLGALAYFVGYKKFYQTHRATSFKREVMPEGPGLEGHGAYPSAAYGGPPPSSGANGFNIDGPRSRA